MNFVESLLVVYTQMIFNIMKSNIYLEAPNYLKPGEIKDWERTVFLAGSISTARNWQIEAKE